MSRCLNFSWLGALIALLALAGFGTAQSHRAVPCLVGRCPDCESPPRSWRLVVLGSSTAAGAGAAPRANSWEGRLASATSGKGLTVLNVSISGTKTSGSLDRFDRDVRPLEPDLVVLATSVMNESPFSNFPSLRRTYMQNTRELIARVQEIGAIPILVTPYPSDGLTPALRLQMLEIAREFEAEGVTVWDFWNAMDDGAGRWLPGLSWDGIHVGNTGHLGFFESIPLGFFDFALASDHPLPSRPAFGSWIAEAADGVHPAIAVSPASPAPSWSAAFWTSSDGKDDEKTLLEVYGPQVRVRRIGKRFELLLHGEVVAAGDASESGGFQHICVTHQWLTGTVTLHVNGKAAGAATSSALEPAVLFSLGNTGERPGIQGDRVAQFLVYRTPLCAEDVWELALGRVPVKSLEAHLPLAQSPARRNQNVAPTIVDIAIWGDWRWVPDGPGATAVR